jgi:hypothetical protein
MNVTSAIFERLDHGVAPGFLLRLYATGSGFRVRAPPLLARVGDVPVEDIFLVPGGGGFTGFLAKAPNAGDRLYVRYADEREFMTDVVYGTTANA